MAEHFHVVAAPPMSERHDRWHQRRLVERSLWQLIASLPQEMDLRGRQFTVEMDHNGVEARAELVLAPWERTSGPFLPRSMKVAGHWRPVVDVEIPYYGD